MTIESLNQQEIAKIIEAILFVASEPVTVDHLAAVIECPAEGIEAALAQLAEDGQQRGIRLQRHGQKVQLGTAPDFSPYLERFLGLNASAKLSTPALETLAIVAYRQPITRPEIDAIRGVNSDGVLRTLISKGLIEEIGRMETVGHPSLFGTTFEFLRYFGLESLDNLPQLELPQVELPRNGAGLAVAVEEEEMDDAA